LDDSDHTVPPIKSLRFDSPTELYQNIPEVADFTIHRPIEGEENYAYLDRLKSSTTPEDALTYVAFCAEMRTSIVWAMQVYSSLLPVPEASDTQLLAQLHRWLEYPNNETRWDVLRSALFWPQRSPVVYLGLAAGWSSGPIAPHDPSSPPAWRAPKAVNAAVLTTLAKGGSERRSINLATTFKLADNLFRVY
jgi:hypothetical protein